MPALVSDGEKRKILLLPKHIICKNTEYDGGDMAYVDEQVNTVNTV